MIRDIARHKGDYSVLAVLATLYIAYFLQNSSRPHYLVYSTIAFAAAYSLWGVWHHVRTKTLTTGVMLEYVLVSVLGVVIVSSLLI